MKIRLSLEDYRIEEVARLNLVPRGRYCAYKLEKRGWSTIPLLIDLAKRLRLPLEAFSYGGRLDRDAVTSQLIVIESKKLDNYVSKSCLFSFVGYTDSLMGPELVTENRFEIIVRDLHTTQASSLHKETENIKKFGFPNYFDDTRFGGYDSTQGFLAEKVLKGHMNGAAKIYLTAVGRDEAEEDRLRKTKFFELWKDWKACLSLATTPAEKTAFHYLIRKPDDFLGFLYEIPRETALAAFGSYQAYLWNETLRRLLRARLTGEFKSYEGLAGDYIFYDKLTESESAYCTSLQFPTISPKMEIFDPTIRKIHEILMNEQGIERILFNKTKYRKVFFKSANREAVAMPRSLSTEIFDDTMHPGKKALKIKADLSYGCYGGMLLKRFFTC